MILDYILYTSLNNLPVLPKTFLKYYAHLYTWEPDLVTYKINIGRVVNDFATTTSFPYCCLVTGSILKYDIIRSVDTGETFCK